jgi:3-methylfumaryl-CoA hydratase
MDGPTDEPDGRTELIQPGPALALAALLGVPEPDFDAGLPLLWHWFYLLDRPAQHDLGPDGHPVRGTVVAPPGPGRRRMWAGGRVRVNGPLRCGEPATRRSKVLSLTDKQGRSGALTFAVVGHEIVQDGRVVIDEQQDIVYRAPSAFLPVPEAGPEVPPADGEWAIDVSPTLLFRFSALTYNAHRIHYDRDYSRDVEGYPGLLTHGPLQALAMAETARAHGFNGFNGFSGFDRGASSFEYRLVSPLFDHQGLLARAVVTPEGFTTAVRDRYGRQTATGALRTGR